jgi:hypothetical protein
MDPNAALRQLGGNKFIAMTGAKNFVYSEKDNYISFKIPRAAQNINFIKITLNAMDTYDIEFGHISGKLEYKVIKQIDGIYNDQLQSIFTQETKLYTSLTQEV